MGTRAPFEKVVARHGATVLRVCQALLGKGDADDAWSETFLAALRAYPRLPADANVKGWLVTIAHRKAIDATRARRRRSSVAQGDGRERVTPDPTVRPELIQALGTLSPRQQQVVTLHHLAGLPHARIAALLGCTPAAARRAASDGIAALRTLYEVPHRSPRRSER